MKTTELFEKHFGDAGTVDFDHPQIEPFLGEPDTVCLLEDIEFANMTNGDVRAVYVNRQNHRRFLLGNYGSRTKAERLSVNRLKTLFSDPPCEFGNFLNSK